MAFDETLAERVRKALGKKRGLSEKPMFGGLAFLLKDKMCCGVLENKLVIRVNPDGYDKALTAPGVKPMDFTGRPMRGFLYVEQEGIKDDKSLQNWVKKSADYILTLKKTTKGTRD